MEQRRELPPISKSISGVKLRKLRGDRVLFTVEPVAARAGSVPLRNAPTATTQRQKQVERYFSTSAHDPAMKGIVSWTKTLEDEKKNFPSTSMWCELMLNKVLKETQHLPTPNALRTAVCCMLLHRLCPLLGHCEQLMSSLLFEVFSAVYVDWSEYMVRKFVDFSHGNEDEDDAEGGGVEKSDLSGGRITIKNDYDAHALDDPRGSRKYLVAALNQRTTYFQAHDTLQNARIHILGAPARCLERCIQSWITTLVRVVFNVWRSESKTASNRHVKASGIVDRIFATKSRNRLKIHFNAWRKVTLDRQNLFAQENTQQKLLQRMGRRIKELEEENGTLKEQFVTLMDEHRQVARRLVEMNGMMTKFRTPLGDLLGHESKAEGVDGQGSKGNATTAQNENATLDVDSIEGVSFLEAPGDPEEEFKISVYKDNDAALLPKVKSLRRRRSSTDPDSVNKQSQQLLAASLLSVSSDATSAPPTLLPLGAARISSPKSSTVVNTAEIEEVSHRPNRVKQLSDFLALDDHAGVDRPSALMPKTAITVVKKEVVLPNYTDVLDWVSVRTQLITLSSTPFAKRCSNFTADFKDGLRLACLLVTLGADKSLLEETVSLAPVARAGIVLRAAHCFYLPDDSFYDDAHSVQANDLVKGKGNKVSRLVFGLYNKYKSVPLEVSASHLELEVAHQLVDEGFMKPLVLQSLINAAGNNAASVNTNELSFNSNSSPTGRSRREPTGADDKDIGEGSGYYGSLQEAIPESQFLHWFRDLAASDSDEDLDNFASMQQSVLDAGSVVGSVVKNMERRLSRSSLSFVNKGDTRAMTEKMGSWGVSRAKAKRKDANSALISSWMKEKVRVTHPEYVEDPNREVHPLDALEAVLEAMYPKLPFGGRDIPTRIKRMEVVLHNKLHLTHVRLDGGKSTEVANQQVAQMPVKQLLMFLYMIDKGAVMSK